MTLSKETNIANSVVVVGQWENQHDWRSTDGIYINRTYTLIYSNDLFPNKVVSVQFSGLRIQSALLQLFRECKHDWEKIGHFRRQILGPLVEIWGNANIDNRKFMHPRKDLTRLVRKSGTSRKHKDLLMNGLAMYVAFHSENVDGDGMAVHVADQHDVKPLSRAEFEADASEGMKSIFTYEEYVASTINDGCFVINYPDAENVQKLKAKH